MEPRYEVVVVGAGVVGCSVAFHLARLGQRGVCLLEREPAVGRGSTSRANGGIRAQFTTRPNVEMSLRSMEILDALEAEIGAPPVYRKAGYLFLTAVAARLESMERAVAFQRSLGVAVELLDSREARLRAPWVAGDDLIGGTFGSRDGFLDPGSLTHFFLRGARSAGVELRCGAEVTGIERTAGSAFRIHAARGGPIEAERIVDAAGPWAADVAAHVGVHLPVEPVRRHIVTSGPCSGLPSQIPMTIDADTGVLIRREGERVAIAYSNPDEPAGFRLDFDADFPERFAPWLERRFPLVARAGVDLRHSWVGLYEVTPDHHAIVGSVEDVPGFFLANGFSGHGVMHAPAVGAALAELIVTGQCASVNLAPLALSRFARGEEIHETMVL